MKEIDEFIHTYKGTPGVLMYLLGNENNYGLFWEGAETENIPVEERKSTIQAKFMYQLFNEAAVKIKRMDSSRLWLSVMETFCFWTSLPKNARM